MYERITDDDPYKTPMRIYPASHYTMGGLWVDYNLMSTIPGLFVLGEANFSDHGANRLGASALMQGLADGYFVIPNTIGGYLAGIKPGSRIASDHKEVKAAVQTATARTEKLMSIGGKSTPTDFHRELGKVMWENCGMARTEASLKKALELIPELRERFYKDLCIPGSGSEVNQSLEVAGRVADFIELGELLCRDALERRESCGAHFREEWQTEEGEALRDDENFAHVAAWEYTGEGNAPTRHVEPLEFKDVHLATRSYK
jgi:succinate dehydrogenase / fumarate reductase flavoprotein subunit